MPGATTFVRSRAGCTGWVDNAAFGAGGTVLCSSHGRSNSTHDVGALGWLHGEVSRPTAAIPDLRWQRSKPTGFTGTILLRTGNQVDDPPRFKPFHPPNGPVQDAYVRLYERWDRVKGLEDPEGYLLRTAMNIFRDRFRRAARSIRRGFVPVAREDDLLAIEDRDEVVRMLRPLAPRQRAAVVATSILDMSAEEAGRVLGMNASTVRALASRGRFQILHRAKEPSP